MVFFVHGPPVSALLVVTTTRTRNRFTPLVWWYCQDAHVFGRGRFLREGHRPAATARNWRRERDSNPRYFLGTHAFQACALNHSAISPPSSLNLNKLSGTRNDFWRVGRLLTFATFALV